MILRKGLCNQPTSILVTDQSIHSFIHPQTIHPSAWLVFFIFESPSSIIVRHIQALSFFLSLSPVLFLRISCPSWLRFPTTTTTTRWRSPRPPCPRPKRPMPSHWPFSSRRPTRRRSSIRSSWGSPWGRNRTGTWHPWFAEAAGGIVTKKQ